MAEVTVEKTKNCLVIRIPLQAVQDERASLSVSARAKIDTALKAGLEDIKEGKVFGPFQSVREFKKTLKTSFHA